MNKLPSISIAIPTNNEEANIARCLNSIFCQRYKGRLEVFVIDGGSTDTTLSIAKKYNVKILNNQMKQAEYGKKVGLMKATGTYFMILDCDMDLVGDHWFERMVEPLEQDLSIVGSWAKFISNSGDAPLNRYISQDPLQRDPLFIFLTPSISDCVVKKNARYWTVQYINNKLLPAGFCLYRRKQIMSTIIGNMYKYMELDNLVIFQQSGETKYAYVQDIGIHHPFLTTFDNLARKRIRNLNTMYFNQPERRYWTWIDWENPYEKAKVIAWIFYCYLLFPSVVVGLWKCLKYRSWLGLYELPFNLLTTSVIVMQFLKHSEGRSLWFK